MGTLRQNKSFLFILLAFIGWLFCGAIMGIGPAFLSMQTTLIVHAIGGPAGFILLFIIFFRKFPDASPWKTALACFLFVFLMDFLIVAPFFVKSFDMFRNVLGTWLPFTLICIAVLLTGLTLSHKK